MPKCSILVSFYHSTLSQPSFESFRCLFENFILACTCAFLRRGALWALHDFSALQHCVLLMVIWVTVVPGALWSLKSSFLIVMGCSHTFFIIRFTSPWQILRGAPDRERLIINWCFFHFLIIALTVDSSPCCLPIALQPIPFECMYTILYRMSLYNSFVLSIVERSDSDSLMNSVN